MLWRMDRFWNGNRGSGRGCLRATKSVKEPLLAHLRDVWRVHRKDLREGAGRVVLPFALAKKYPNADREWAWGAFPAPTRYFDREAKIERRHHLHETVVQKAMRGRFSRQGSRSLRRLMCYAIRSRRTC
jgi:hypothetical protein